MNMRPCETTAIEFRNVWKVFGSQQSAIVRQIAAGIRPDTSAENVVAIADVSLAVRHGETFCIMGLSGSGKSTLVRHVNRLIEPTAGSVRVLGQDVAALAPEELRQLRSETIGMVFQNFGLLPHRSVIDNVALPLEVRRLSRFERESRAERALSLVELSGWEDRRVDQLSGGMQQRVGIARALAADPPILLMDEPFSALDPLIRRQLQTLFKGLIKRFAKTTLFITHDLDEAVRMGDRIAILREGKLVQVGTPEDIVLRPVDNYVAAFVSDLSPSKVLRASAIVTPLAEFKDHTCLANFRRVNCDADLASLLSISVESDGPLLVVDAVGDPIGVVTPRDLLRGLKGR